MSDARPDLDETDDDTLIQAIQQGKPEAFERFLDRHVHHVRAFLALKAPVAHLVDELAHEAFVFAYRNVHEFTGLPRYPLLGGSGVGSAAGSTTRLAAMAASKSANCLSARGPIWTW